MYQDVVHLRAFYHSPLGSITSRLIRRQIRTIWPNVSGMDVLGLGYAIPFMGSFMDEANHAIAMMPSQQGVIRWPRYSATRKDRYGRFKGNLAFLAEENRIPLKDASMDRIIMAHMLEHTESSKHLLREVWRTLSPGGRLIIIVPNRMGPWCRTDRTPFGHGRPYSKNQINRILSDNMLTPINWGSALAMPPFKNRTLLSMMMPLENTGLKWWKNIAGAHIIEAEKQIYAANGGNKVKIKATKPAIVHSPLSIDKK